MTDFQTEKKILMNYISAKIEEKSEIFSDPKTKKNDGKQDLNHNKQVPKQKKFAKKTTKKN